MRKVKSFYFVGTLEVQRIRKKVVILKILDTQNDSFLSKNVLTSSIKSSSETRKQHSFFVRILRVQKLHQVVSVLKMHDIQIDILPKRLA